MNSSVSCISDAEETSGESICIDTIQKQFLEEKKKLLKANMELSNQVIDYRQKLENSLNASSQYNSIIAQNEINQKEILRLQNENKDLHNRLNILIQNFQILKDQKNSENIEDHKNLSNELETQLSNQKRKYQEELDEVRKQCENETQRLQIEVQKYQNFKNDLELIYQKAGNYFEIYIDSPKSLVKCFKNQNSQLQPTYSVIKNLKSDTYKLLKKIESQQKLIENLKQSESEKIAEIELMNKKNTTQKNQLKNSIEEINHRNLMLTRQVDDLTAENENLHSNLTEKECLIKSLQIEKEAIENEKQSLNQQFINQNRNLQKIIKNNKMLNTKLTSSQDLNRQFEAKNQDLIKQQKEIELQYQNKTDQLNSQKVLFDEKQSKIESLEKENFLYEKKLEEQIKITDQIKSQNDELFLKMNLKDQIIKEKDAKIEEIQKQIFVLNKKQEKEEKKTIIIPTGTFQTAGFPKELQMILKDLTLSENCQCDFVMKLNDLFSEVEKYYRNRCDQLISENKQNNQQLNELNSQIEMIIDFLSRFYSEIKINYRLLLTDEKTRSIFSDFIIKRNEELDQLRTSQMQLENFLKKASISNLSDLNTKLESSNEKIRYLEKKIKKLEKINAYLKSLTNTHDPMENINNDQKEKEKLMQELNILQQNNSKYKQENDEMRMNLQNFEQLKSELVSDNSNLNKIILKQKKKLEKMERNHITSDKDKDDEIKRLKEKNKTEKNELQKRLESFQSQTKTQISDLNEQLRNLHIKNIEIEEKCKLLNSENSELKLKIKKNDTQIQANRQEFDRERSNMQSQFNIRLVSLQNEYKMKIEEKENKINEERRQIGDALSKNFSNLADGIRIDARNIESVCSIIKRKIDERMRSEAELRRLMENSVQQKKSIKRNNNDVIYY